MTATDEANRRFEAFCDRLDLDLRGQVKPTVRPDGVLELRNYRDDHFPVDENWDRRRAMVVQRIIFERSKRFRIATQ
jgi:hypothetical protein